MDADCIFCQIIEGKLPRTLVLEDADTIVIKDIYPKAPIHLLVIPKKHISDFMALQPPEIDTMMQVVARVISKNNITHYRIVNNGGGAQLIDHVHIHILGSFDRRRNL